MAHPARLWTRRATVALVALAVATLALVARADAFVYWASSSTNSIGRANLDGTGANQSFITTANDPSAVVVNGAVAVDAAHVYWANTGTPPAFGNSIGRANIDGTGANQNFIPTPSAPTGVAVDAAHVIGHRHPRARSAAQTSTALVSPTRALSAAPAPPAAWRSTARTSIGRTSTRLDEPTSMARASTRASSLAPTLQRG